MSIVGRFRADDGRSKLFADTVARPMAGGRWALMNRQDTGLASQALMFNTLEGITARFAVKLGARGEDRFGEFVLVHRLDAKITDLRDAPVQPHTCVMNANDTGHCSLCGEKVLRGPVVGLQGKR